MDILTKIKNKLSIKFLAWGLALSPEPHKTEFREAILERVHKINELIQLAELEEEEQ